MMLKKSLILLLLVLCSISFTEAQNAATDPNKRLIQFSGLVLTADSIYPIPFANVWVKGKINGDYTNIEGYFSFVAERGDTVVFSHVEFKESSVVIPDTLTGFKYSIVKMLTRDTINLPGFVISPFPSRTKFDYMFVNKDIPDDDLERARKNLEAEALRDEAGRMGMDGSENYKNFMRQQYQRQYYAGQTPPIGLLNPFAWAQFFQAWKRGDFKSKKKSP